MNASCEAAASAMRFSDFGEKFSAHSGIFELMEDLGAAMAQPANLVMMGGGAPAHLPEVEALWRARLQDILATPGRLEVVLGDYDTPRGNAAFLEAFAGHLRRRFGWDVTPDNIALTTGSQAASFLLINLLAGPAGGRMRRILFPLVPEYIGYADQGIARGMFTAWQPRIEHTGPHRFKYCIDFREIGDDIAAIWVSRPTNPTANLVTDEEIRHLTELAAGRGIPLVIDNAYGHPFPGVTFKPVTLPWGPHIIHTFSLSKLGLPGTRTGIVVGPRAIIRRLGVMNANLTLANCSLGQAILAPLLTGDLLENLTAKVIRPFYETRSRQTLEWLATLLDDRLDYHVHECEGAFFVWVWIRGLPIDDRTFYQRLKTRGLIVVPGSYFFPGLEAPWRHRHECLRLSYTAPLEQVRRGLEIFADALRQVAGAGRS